MGRARDLGRGPSEPRKHASQRPGEPRDRIRNHRETEGPEALRIAIGADGDRIGLCRQSVDDMRQHGLAAEVEEGLISATHAARLPASKDDARDAGFRSVHGGMLRGGLPVDQAKSG